MSTPCALLTSSTYKSGSSHVGPYPYPSYDVKYSNPYIDPGNNPLTPYAIKKRHIFFAKMPFCFLREAITGSVDLLMSSGRFVPTSVVNVMNIPF